MSLPDRRTFLALLAASPLAACTFTPAYAPGGPAATLQGAIRVDSPDTKDGFALVERLEERVGRAQEARFDLSYTITTKSIGVGVTPENATPRYNITGQVDWALKDHTGAAILTGIAQSFTSWSATGSTVAGLAAEEDASYRLMRILADQIVTRLLAASGTFL